MFIDKNLFLIYRFWSKGFATYTGSCNVSESQKAVMPWAGSESEKIEKIGDIEEGI